MAGSFAPNREREHPPRDCLHGVSSRPRRTTRTWRAPRIGRVSVRSRQSTRLRRRGAVTALAISAAVIPIATACDTGDDSTSGTTTVERTVVAPPEAATTGQEVPSATGQEAPSTTAAPPATTDSTSTPEGAGPGFVWFAQADDGALRPVAGLATDPGEVADAVAAGTDDPDLVGGLPPGTAVQSVALDGTTVIVDLSEDFVIGYQAGSAAETVTVAPLVYSLTELPAVDSVLITVDGVAPTPVGASFDFAGPLSRADIPAVFAEGFG